MEMLTRQLDRGGVGNMFDQITRRRGGAGRMTSVKSKVFTFTIPLLAPPPPASPPEHDADIITAGLQSERGIFYCVRNILCK